MGSRGSDYPIGGGGRATSGQQDKGYKGGASYHHAVGDNLDDLQSHYTFREGYFGKAHTRKQTKNRDIQSEDPLATARDFYARASYGGIESTLDNGEGVKTKMSDGTIITMREVSHSPDRSPAVDINIKESSGSGGIKQQKIHFETKVGD